MRQGTYLNVILTVNAVLLSGLLWTQIVERPVLKGPAVAQSRSAPNPSDKDRFYRPNAAQQRNDQTEVLKKIHVALEKQTKMLSDGKLRVEVSNLDEIEFERE